MGPKYCRRNPLKTGLSTASLKVYVRGQVAVFRRRNPLKTGLSTARRGQWTSSSPPSSKSQSPENGSQHCKLQKVENLRAFLRTGRNPLKTGLSTASPNFSKRIGIPLFDCRNPLKTGLSTARPLLPRFPDRIAEQSQSPENGSQHCKRSFPAI